MTQNTKRSKPNELILGHNYQGYRIESPNEELDIVPVDISSEDFDTKYIKPHRPCIIRGVIPGLDIDKFQIDNILDTVDYEGELQVERKVSGGFGSGDKRLKMKFDEFIGKLIGGDNDLYLTTQYENSEDVLEENIEDSDNDNDNEDEGDIDEENEKGFLDDQFSDTDSIDMNNLHDDFIESDEEESILQPPLTYTLDIPMRPKLFESSIPQQINLWIGSSGEKLDPVKIDPALENLGVGRHLPDQGTSSGLHHDHSDNLYIPIQGNKRFTLFSPYDADSMYTVGDIYKVYENGVIDYEVNERLPNWKHVNLDGSVVEEMSNDKVESKLDPPSFSKIPPFFIHLQDVQEKKRSTINEYIKTHYPKLLQIHSITVHLQKGDMLFLPCGWFHEVTSYGGVHILLNYWFVPRVN